MLIYRVRAPWLPGQSDYRPTLAAARAHVHVEAAKVVDGELRDDEGFLNATIDECDIPEINRTRLCELLNSDGALPADCKVRPVERISIPAAPAGQPEEPNGDNSGATAEPATA